MDSQNTKTTSKDEVQALVKTATETRKTDIAEAIKILEQAAKVLTGITSDDRAGSVRNPTNTQTTLEIHYLSKLGNILYELGNYDEAEVCAKQLKVLLPVNVQVYKRYGDCLRKKGANKEALKQYKDGLAIFAKDRFSTPTDKAGLLNNKGLTHVALEEYKEAQADFEAAIKIAEKNPLYYCNLGTAVYGLGDQSTAINHFKKANELLKSGEFGELTKHNITYIQKTLEEFINKLENLANIGVEGGDIIMEAREREYVKAAVDSISPENSNTANGVSNVSDTKGNQLILSKKGVADVKKDPKLRAYYDGLMFTLSQSYTTSVNILSNLFVLDSGPTLTVSVVSKAISLLPLVGSQLSEGIETIHSFIQETQMRDAAIKVSSFSTTGSDFDKIGQDAICQALIAKETEIKKLNESDINDYFLPKWVSQFKNLKKAILKVAKEADPIFYGRYATPLQKLGYETANILVSEHIANGKIYGGVEAIELDESELQERLKNTVLQVIDEILNAPKIAMIPDTEIQADQGKTRTPCCECQMFAVSKIVYDNPLLNHRSIFTELSAKLGVKRVLEASDLLAKEIIQDLSADQALPSDYLMRLLELLQDKENL